MPLSPNRPEFKAAIKMEDVPPPIERALSYVRSSTVKSLYWKNLLISFLAVFWLLAGFAEAGLGVAAWAGKLPFIAADDDDLIGAAALAMGIATAVTGLGCLLRAQWGRLCGLALSTIQLPIGLIGWYALFGSTQLFGPERLDGGELREEYRHRKKRYGA